MRIIKQVFGVALVVTSLIGTAQAQYKVTTLVTTNDVPNSSTTTANLGGPITATKYGEVGLSIQFALNAAGTTACTFNFVKSPNAGTNYETGAWYSVSMVPNGTTMVSTNVTVTMGPFGYLKPFSFVAANNTAAMTNISIQYVLKPNRLDGK